MSKNTVAYTAALLSFILNLSCHADTLFSLTKSELEQVVVNNTLKSVAIDNLNGQTINNTFSMYMDDQGKIYGKMSLKPIDQPQYDQGTYSISDDGTFYITWQHWDEQQTLCGHLFTTANAYISVDCDDIFHTVFMTDDIQPGNHIQGGLS